MISVLFSGVALASYWPVSLLHDFIKPIMPDCHDPPSLDGGETVEVDDLCQLKRIFCTAPTDDLGDASQQILTRLLSSPQWQVTIDTVLQFIRSGRAVRRRPMIWALAFSTSRSTGDRAIDLKIRQTVYGSLSDVFQTPSDLFQLFHYEIQFLNHRMSAGRCKRTAIGKWYNGKTAMNLAYLVTKYRKRCGWSHRDILRVAHVKPTSDGIPHSLFNTILGHVDVFIAISFHYVNLSHLQHLVFLCKMPYGILPYVMTCICHHSSITE